MVERKKLIKFDLLVKVFSLSLGAVVVFMILWSISIHQSTQIQFIDPPIEYQTQTMGTIV